jgi:hypothetical protein
MFNFRLRDCTVRLLRGDASVSLAFQEENTGDGNYVVARSMYMFLPSLKSATKFEGRVFSRTYVSYRSMWTMRETG